MHVPILIGQPKIDSDSSISMATECARICVNPQGSTGFRGLRIPVEAVHSVSLDHEVIQDIDPKTWAVSGAAHARKFPNASVVVEDVGPKLSMAEKFRLAFMDRDARLAPKRAKNERQNRRRAEKELLMTSTSAKSLALASQAANTGMGDLLGSPRTSQLNCRVRSSKGGCGHQQPTCEWRGVGVLGLQPGNGLTEA
ncbi:hypothetical protein KSP40_PGU016756 [Platanthera guangdongensis]|uniref:Uncharacterized protein n=1 Tax=Platanthera guangdongensis TaxID=2320717 RepID=A0ABR2MXE3_9ASPA